MAQIQSWYESGVASKYSCMRNYRQQWSQEIHLESLSETLDMVKMND